MTPNITLTFAPSPQLRVFRLQVNLPYRTEDVIAELENENWVPPVETSMWPEHKWTAVRFKVCPPSAHSKILWQISNFFSSDELKRQIVNYLFEHIPGFDVEYMMNADQMCNKTIFHGEFTKDMPGFVNVMHTDYRLLVATGMVYFSTIDNPDISSYFYTSAQRDNPFRMSTEFGGGWFHANGNDTYHEGWNRTDQVRYSCLLGLTLNVTPVASRS